MRLGLTAMISTYSSQHFDRRRGMEVADDGDTHWHAVYPSMRSITFGLMVGPTTLEQTVEPPGVRGLALTGILVLETLTSR